MEALAYAQERFSGARIYLYYASWFLGKKYSQFNLSTSEVSDFQMHIIIDVAFITFPTRSSDF